MLFTADGTHCTALLNPGHHRVYVTWAQGVVDVWDLDVVAGKTYFATVAAPKSGWSGYVNEKFAPSSKHWARLSECSALGDVTQLVSRGDSLMSKPTRCTPTTESEPSCAPLFRGARMIDFEQVELSSFGRATTPHFYRANTFVAWCSGELGGIFATAPQRPHDIEPALALFQQMIRAGSTHDLLIDARRFGVDGLALSGAFQAVAGVRAAMKHHCRRFCVVLPDDWSHAWWVGTIALCAPRPVRRHTVDDMNAATRWLDAAPTLVQSLDALAAKYGAPSLRGDVEERLRKDPTASIEQLARVLGLSPRSLQRALREAGSTFAALRSTVRAELAATMLTSTTSKMDRVASSIGFRSKSHFTAWFRRINGRSPAEFRRTTAAAANHATAR